MLEAWRGTRSRPGGLPRPAAPWRLINLLLLAAVTAAGVVAYFIVGGGGTAEAQVTTGTVQRGSVLLTVSASGNVQPAGSVDLNFSASGKVAAVYVKQGLRVRKGQALAKLADSTEVAAVRTARANLASARANLTSLGQPLTAASRRENQVAVDQAQAGIANQQTALRDAIAAANQDRRSLQKAVDQAQAALAQTRKTAAANEISLRSTVGEAKGAWLEAKASASRDLANLQSALDQANAQLQQDQVQFVKDQNDASTYAAQVGNANASVGSLQTQVDADKARVADDQRRLHADKCDLPAAPQPKCANDAYRLSQDQAQLSDDQVELSAAQADQNTARSKLDAANSAVSSGQTKIAADQNAITNAQNALATGQLKDAQSVTQAYRAYVNAKTARVSGLASNRQSVQNAKNSVKNAIASLNAGTIKDKQPVHSAQASLKSARQSLQSTLAANAVKREPATAGELENARAQVTSAEVAVENALTAERQMTLRAPAPGTVASISGAVGETPGGGASSSSDSSSAFITLVDLDRPEVAAGFSESDAAKIKVGQAATITVDALPGEQLAAHVVSIDTTQTVVSNVVTYGVTFVLDRSAPELKPGMTVSAAVIVAERDGVLHVPSAAVHARGGASYVTVVASDGTESERTVRTGLVGDDSTEIVDGLTAGQEIVASTLTSLTGTTPTSGRGGIRGAPGGGVFQIGPKG